MFINTTNSKGNPDWFLLMSTIVFCAPAKSQLDGIPDWLQIISDISYFALFDSTEKESWLMFINDKKYFASKSRSISDNKYHSFLCAWKALTKREFRLTADHKRQRLFCGSVVQNKNLDWISSAPQIVSLRNCLLLTLS